MTAPKELLRLADNLRPASGKTKTLSATAYKGGQRRRDLHRAVVPCALRGKGGRPRPRLELASGGKTNALTTVTKDNLLIILLRTIPKP